MFFELTSAQIDQFNEDGFVIVDKLIDDETIEALRARYEKLFRGEFETGILPDEVNWQESESDPSLTRQICNGWKADRTIASVVMRADLGKAIATLSAVATASRLPTATRGSNNSYTTSRTCGANYLTKGRFFS